MQALKKIRVGLAVVMLVLVAVVFLDFTNHVPPSWTTVLVGLQIIPSLTKLITGLTVASIGLIVVVALTLTFGRVYCSTICPLGTLQDIVIRLSGRMRRRRWYRYKPAPLFLHYGLLAISGIVAIAGSMALVDLLEPFSNFGRILTNLADPVLVSANNAAASVLGRFRIFALYNVPLLHVRFMAVLLTLAFLVLIVYLSYRHGRLFCNMLCPAGALLGLLSKFSFFKIAIVEERCTDCGFCEMVCKANCIDSESKKIDFNACIGCFNCIDACPTVALKFDGFWKKKREAKPLAVDEPRRAFLGAVAATSSLLLMTGTNAAGEQVPQNVTFDESRSMPVTPPGSQRQRPVFQSVHGLSPLHQRVPTAGALSIDLRVWPCRHDAAEDELQCSLLQLRVRALHAGLSEWCTSATGCRSEEGSAGGEGEFYQGRLHRHHEKERLWCMC